MAPILANDIRGPPNGGFGNLTDQDVQALLDEALIFILSLALDAILPDILLPSLIELT